MDVDVVGTVVAVIVAFFVAGIGVTVVEVVASLAVGTLPSGWLSDGIFVGLLVLAYCGWKRT